MEIRINIVHLRRALGLSDHPMMAQGLFNTTPAPFVPLNAPNRVDIDHDPEHDLGMNAEDF